MNLELRKLLEFINFHPSIEVEEVQQKAHQALTLSEELNSLEGKIISMWAIALFHISKGQHSQGERLLSQALKFCEQSDDLSLKGRILSALGGLYFQKNQIKKSLDHLLEALKFIDPFWEGATFNTIGLIYRDQGQYEQSDQYLQKAVIRAVEQKNFSLHISSLLNFANNKVLQKKFDFALDLYQETLEKSLAYQFKRGEIYSLIHLTRLYDQKGETREALKYCNELIAVAEKESYLKEYIRGLQNKGRLLIKSHSYTEGEEHLKKALQLAEGEKLTLIQKELLQQLFQQKEQNGQLNEAIHYLKKLNELHEQELREKDQLDINKRLSEQEDQINFLNNQKEKITKQNDELKQYAYIVAHDLKEPLRNISSFASLLQRRYYQKLDQDGKDFIKFIQSGAKHMYQQLEDLLLYATLDNLPNKADEVNLNEVLKEVLFNLRRQIQQTRAEIHYDELPTIMGIKVHFTQIFQNLIQNALKFQHPGRHPVIKITAIKKQKYFFIYLQDNGIGIELKYQKTIFKIFKRLDRQNYPGTGIGLAVCQKLVKLYAGDIWVESSKDQEGTTFCFTLGMNGLQSQ